MLVICSKTIRENKKVSYLRIKNINHSVLFTESMGCKQRKMLKFTYNVN